MKRIELSVDGKRTWVWAERLQGKLWIHFDGRIIVHEPSQGQRHGRGSDSVGSGVVDSPMPGKIMKTMVKVGDDVSAGDALLVLEAMKMEYTLEASVDGEISELNCAVGDQVTQGQVLAVVVSDQAPQGE